MPDRPAALIPSPGADLAAAVAAAPVPNLRRIGGEMFAWTDRDPRRGPEPPRGAVLRHLLGTLAGPGRTVLVAGPHADDLVAALTGAGAEVTWLLRSLGDAEEAARAHPGVTVLAGAAVKLDPAARYDLVVAADGLDRLNSAEGDQLTAAELIQRLADAVTPGGTLVLVHDNRLGLHHTVRLADPARPDAAWYPADDHDEHRPASRQQLEAAVAATGLVPGPVYTAFPDPSAPTVLIGPDVRGDVSSSLRAPLAAALARAVTAAFRDRPVLGDPRRLLTRALRAGAEDTVAAAWVVVAGPAARHDVLVGDPDGTFAYELARDGAGVRTTVVAPAEPQERDGFRRAGVPVGAGVGAGYLLEERLLHLCARADLPGLRAEAGRFAEWLTGQAAGGELTGPVALAGVADVLVTTDGPVLLPVRWEPLAPVPLETALVRACWRFAVQLITAGHPHPWPITADAAELTGILLTLMDRDTDEAGIRAAVELEVRVEAAELGLDEAERGERRRHLLSVGPGTAPIDGQGYRELTEALWRQRYQASHLLAMMEWTEQIISSRDHTLSKLDWEIQYYRRTWAGRILMLGRKGYGLAKKAARRALRRG